MLHVTLCSYVFVALKTYSKLPAVIVHSLQDYVQGVQFAINNSNANARGTSSHSCVHMCVLQAARDGRPVPSSVTQAAVRVQSMALTWCLLALTDEEGEEEDDSAATATVAQLSTLVNDFVGQLQTIGDECGDDYALADVVVRAQADIYMVFDAAKLQVRLCM